MPNTEADAIVQKVQNQLDTHGRNAETHAYTTLLNEYQQYKDTHSQCQTDALSRQLEQSGVLPKVAVGWLREDFDKINTYKDDFGITRSEVSQFTQSNGSAKSDLDSMLANQILSPGSRGRDQFDAVAHRNWLNADPDTIERMDLNAYDRQETRHRNREERKENVRDIAAPLFEGSPPLMAVLDAQHNGQCDGRVSERDMRRFLTQCDVQDQTGNAGAWPYTKENAAYVSDLLNGAYPELTGPNFTGFSARALARRAGMDHVKINSIDDYQHFAAVYSDRTAPKEPYSSGDQPDPCEPSAPVADKPQEQPQPDHSEVFSQVDDMSHYRKGEGQWHVAKRLLNAGNDEGEKSASNKDIWKLSKDIMHYDGTTSLDAKGRSHPIVHPGDQAPVMGHIDALFAKNPKLADSIFRLEQKNNAKKQAAAATDSGYENLED